MIATLATPVIYGAALATGFNCFYWLRDQLKKLWKHTLGPTVDSILARIRSRMEDIVYAVLVKLKRAYGYPYSSMVLADKVKEVLSRVYLRLAYGMTPNQYIYTLANMPTVPTVQCG
jgi:hypothetical protein